jgi:ABC-type iron transport system FetAB permease component
MGLGLDGEMMTVMIALLGIICFVAGWIIGSSESEEQNKLVLIFILSIVLSVTLIRAIYTIFSAYW